MKIGKVNLSDPRERRRVGKVSVELQLQTEALTKKDLRNWRNAWQQAINVEYPNRVTLYDIYGDVDVDMHLTGCVGQRKGYVMNKSFRIVNRAGEENPDLTSHLRVALVQGVHAPGTGQHQLGALAHPVGRHHRGGWRACFQQCDVGSAPACNTRIRRARYAPARNLAKRIRLPPLRHGRLDCRGRRHPRPGTLLEVRPAHHPEKECLCLLGHVLRNLRHPLPCG